MAKIEVSLSKDDIETIATMVVAKLRNNKVDRETTYTVKEVAKITKKSPQTIHIHIKRGLLKAGRLGREYIITQKQLDDYINPPKKAEILKYIKQ